MNGERQKQKFPRNLQQESHWYKGGSNAARPTQWDTQALNCIADQTADAGTQRDESNSFGFRPKVCSDTWPFRSIKQWQQEADRVLEKNRPAVNTRPLPCHRCKLRSHRSRNQFGFVPISAQTGPKCFRVINIYVSWRCLSRCLHKCYAHADVQLSDWIN